MQCLPVPKCVIKKIDSLCRSFIWNGSDVNSRKSPIAWQIMCRPKSQGGLSIINLVIWNKICMLKCLWNICNKSDNLWVKWVKWTLPKKESHNDSKHPHH